MDINFSKINVVVFGDVMLDEYWIGKCNRISPEAPVPIVSIEKRDLRLGGAANVALNVKSLGASVHIITCVMSMSMLISSFDKGIQKVECIAGPPISLTNSIFKGSITVTLSLDR